jgi:hypothetical protein
MMKLLFRRILRVAMITPLGCTRQVYDRRIRIGVAHAESKLSACRKPVNAWRNDSANMQV